MSEPETPFIETPTYNDNTDANELLSAPFLLVRVADWDDDGQPLWKLYYGSGLGKEDVPHVAEMLHELFPVQRYVARPPKSTPEEEPDTGEYDYATD